MPFLTKNLPQQKSLSRNLSARNPSLISMAPVSGFGGGGSSKPNLLVRFWPDRFPQKMETHHLSFATIDWPKVAITAKHAPPLVPFALAIGGHRAPHPLGQLGVYRVTFATAFALFRVLAARSGLIIQDDQFGLFLAAVAALNARPGLNFPELEDV